MTLLAFPAEVVFLDIARHRRYAPDFTAKIASSGTIRR
jgi:hypothetical protein